jgi:hypothetical protein
LQALLFVLDVITGDEMWVYAYDRETEEWIISASEEHWANLF